MKRFMMLILIIGFLIEGFAMSTITAIAAEPVRKQLTRYYTSVQIKTGESLWSIAADYADESEISISEYVEELKQMNGLDQETIHAGEYLTIVYFK